MLVLGTIAQGIPYTLPILWVVILKLFLGVQAAISFVHFALNLHSSHDD